LNIIIILIVVEFVAPFDAIPEIVTEYVLGVIDDDAVTVKVTDAFRITVVFDSEQDK
jgi:uncharacterized membrane protein YkvA (DUF1232 family)